MAVQRYKAALNNARFPLVSTWGERAVILPAIDASQRSPGSIKGVTKTLTSMSRRFCTERTSCL